jgi:hypothetical protein
MKRKTDAVYLVAHLIKKRYPNAKRIARGVLWFLVNSNPTYGTRSLVQAISQLTLIETNGKVGMQKSVHNTEVFNQHLGSQLPNKKIYGSVEISD